jgi:hypothetical protein
MISSLPVLIGLLQVAGRPLPAGATRPPEPVRVWRDDSIAYVALREPGHLLVLHVDPIGRINVLFPLGPYDGTAIDAGVAFAVPLPPTAQGNPATLVAVRSRWAFDFAALQGGRGGTWNYQDAWLLQPSAGDPLTALLDIADRVTDGRPYDYGGVKYSRDGSVAALGAPLQPQVCLSCVRRGTTVAAAPSGATTNMVDCSNASLTNSFCGVNSGSVSITSVPQAAAQPAPATAPAAVYVPYYLPLIVNTGRRRFEHSIRPMPPPPPPPAASVFPIAPRLVVPSGAQLRTFAGRRH